jgi:hypothetical protein
MSRFDGSDYQPARDDVRLDCQLDRIKACMLDGNYRTLSQIEAVTGDPAASISAQLRHLRKPRFGSFIVDKQYMGNGLYAYRVTAPTGQMEMAV